jgi:cytochrome c oxidase subunit I+III
MAAFASLVFGYFFFWTVHDDFPPGPEAGPGVGWPSLALALAVGAWGATLLARRSNTRAGSAPFHALLGCGVLLALGAAAALLAGPWSFAMDPSAHVYPATVWLLSAWAAVHVAAGVVMQLYCLARRACGQMTPEHDIDIHNVALYWHFAAITVVVTVAVLAGFPLAR